LKRERPGDKPGRVRLLSGGPLMLRWIGQILREIRREFCKTPATHPTNVHAEDEIQKTFAMIPEKQVLEAVKGPFPDHTLDLEESEKFEKMWLVRMMSTGGLSLVIVVFGGLAGGRKLTEQELELLDRTMRSNWFIAVYTMYVSQIGIAWRR
jgi:hypothetical protein